MFVFCFVLCMFRGDILGSFYTWRHGAQFPHYYISGFGENFSYNRLRQTGLINLKWGFLFGALLMDSIQWISFGGFSAVSGILLLSQCCSFNRYNLQDSMLQLNSNPCTEVDNANQQTQLHTWNYRIIISLSLVCYIQCGFSISYISISGIAARDRCNVSHVFLFNSNVVLCL